MDDMIGVPEREDAIVIPISAHPNFVDHTPPEIVIDGDEGYSETYEDPDGVDAEMISILEEAGASEAVEERNAIGNNVCWQCKHRVDRRPLWKKILSTPNEMSYLCGATKRTKVADPVSGQVKWIAIVRGMLGPQLMLVDTPHRTCVEINPDGKCKMFNVKMRKRKKRRKE